MSDRPEDGPPRFPGAIELDTSVQDDPEVALRQALETDGAEQGLGAFRLLEVRGREPKLPAPDAAKLGAWLEGAGMFREAARICRLGAEHDLTHAEAPGLIFRAACLLVGPARRPEPGADMLLYLVANYPDHPQAGLAERIHDLWQDQDLPALAALLLEAGMPMGDVPFAPPVAEPVPDEPAAEAPRLRDRLADRVGPGLLGRIDRVLAIIFVVLLVAFFVTRSLRHRYKGIEEIQPALLHDPVQESVEQPTPIQYEHGDYQYSLLPRFRYEIAGLIVGKNDYTLLGVARKNAYLMDLCMVWGDNAGGRLYQHEGVEIAMHGNVCYTRCSGPICMRSDQLSNNHILTADEELQDAFDDLVPGDQIRMAGFLVDGQVADRGRTVRNPGRMKTSVTRVDNGMGACEIMYVERLDVLDRGNSLWRLLYTIVFWTGLAFIALAITRLVLLPVGRVR